jgi:hypothetical protein
MAGKGPPAYPWQLTDPRVVHLWDAKDVSGAWLAGNVPGYQGSDWDTYLLFGPEATWQSHPTPLRSSGAPVFDQIQRLSKALDPLLTPPRQARQRHRERQTPTLLDAGPVGAMPGR